MGRVASQLKCKNNNNEKKTLPCLSPAPFTSNILLLLNQKKRNKALSSEHFKHATMHDVSTQMYMQGF